MSTPKGRWRIQVCESSLLASHHDTLLRLTEADCVVESVPCLDQCTRCKCSALALVSGRFVVAPSPESFLAKLRLPRR